GINEFTHHRWLGSFRPTEATVTGTRIDEVECGGLKGLAPRVLYAFRVGDEQYLGHKIHWGLEMPSEGGGLPPPDNVIWSREESAHDGLKDVLRHYPAGKKVTAYYDPDDPTSAALVYVPFKPDQHGSGLWFVAGVVVLMWSLFGIACRVAGR